MCTPDVTPHATMFNTITWASEGPVVFISLNRPHKHNAINLEMMRELRTAFDRAAADADVHVVVLSASGRTFSSGIDLSAGILDDTAEMQASMIRDYLPLVESIQACNKLIIASVEGAAIGLACSLVMLCDQLYMSEQASLNLVFTDLGLIADGGANSLLPQKIGYGQALQLVLDAEKLSATRCLALGIANRVLPAEAMEKSVRDLAQNLAARASLPQALSKQLMRAAMAGASLRETILGEAQAQAECVDDEYFQRVYSKFKGN
jgi:2-(1,2-epoxy-1,2-dihydrophenyl)acetyl-CoA isomerase